LYISEKSITFATAKVQVKQYDNFITQGKRGNIGGNKKELAPTVEI